MPATAKQKPRLKNLDDLFLLNGGVNPLDLLEPETPASSSDAEYAIIPFSFMDDFPGHPFRLYEGERETDMVESIRTNGILQPLILRAMEGGRYQILSGHNRKYNGLKAGLSESPAVIKRNLTDDEAWIYVIETNLMQRSFADMAHSEKAAVIAAQHSKLFSQGKRNDILEELKRLENPHDVRENETLRQLGERSHSGELVGTMYGLSSRVVSRYIRIHQLISLLKTRLDNGEIAFIPAVTLSFLKENEQTLLDKCMELNSFTVDMKKADLLRQQSEKGKLDDDSIYLILNSEVRQKPKPNRTPTVKVRKDVYSKYFRPEQSQQEIQGIVEKALELYFSQ